MTEDAEDTKKTQKVVQALSDFSVFSVALRPAVDPLRPAVDTSTIGTSGEARAPSSAGRTGR